MTIMQIILFEILGIIGHLSGADSCKFGANCDYPCHCQNNDVCDFIDGSCPAGCEDGDLQQPGDYWYSGAWYGYGCQIGNVAYAKITRQGPNTWNTYYAENAADGNHNPHLDNCAFVFGHGVPGWWQVDLGDTHVVISVNITLTKHPRYGTANTDITIGNDGDFRLCKKISTGEYVDTIYVNCSSRQVGRIVRVQKNVYSNEAVEMCLCEVQVYGYLFNDCPDGYFGVSCGTPCNCRGPCDNLYGRCSTQNCTEGWTGANCQMECRPGTWGDECREQCRCQNNQEKCNHIDGSCRSGCASEYGGVHCNLELPGLHSKVELSSSSMNTLRIRFHSWSPQNGGGSEPQGYQMEMRHNDTLSWVFGPKIDHDPTMILYIALLDKLKPRTYYYVRVTPFIKDMGNLYYGSPTPEGGPFLTIDEVAADSSTSNVVGAVVGCVFVVILIIVVAVLLRRYRLQKGRNNNVPMSTNVGYSQTNGSIQIGNDSHLLGTRSGGNQSPLTSDGDCESPMVSDGHIYENEEPHDHIYGNREPTDHIYGNQEPLGRPLNVTELESYISEISGREEGFAEEFSQISGGVTAVSEEGKKAENKKLNRFNNICAYDHSRVVLEASFGGNKSGFINASYIHKYKEQPGGYIAAQGPKKSTVVDMWTMVWQTDANRIVMVTNLWEAGRVKCEQYWPDQGMAEFGKFKVSLVDSQKFAEYTIRILSLAFKKSEPRPVFHFHFTGWPDKGVPEEATSLLDFRRKIRSHDDFAKGPLIVHCSAGIGRTGTFLAVDYLLEQAKAEGVVDVVKYTYLMRSNRMNMIQTPVQYAFVYKALLEAHQAGETVILSHEMEARYSELKAVNDETGKRKIEEQFRLLQKWKSARIAAAKDPVSSMENIVKDRDRNVLAANEFRMYLNSQVDGTNDYINAIGIDGYLEHMAYMATQLPLPHTVVDLWRLLYEHKCSCIVMLEPPNPDDESTPVYWPIVKDRPMVIAQLTVSLLTDEDLEEGAIKMMEFEIKINSKNPHIVRLYQFSQWPNGTERPASLETTLKLLDHIQRWQLRTDHGAVCFQCKYGYERSGLMIAACYMLEKLKVDREVDVFHAVKQVRIPRPEFVTSLAQYECLHELAITWINSFGIYANF